MKLGTANIRNYPDMPMKDVVADAKKMAAVCDIWGHQENDPNEDDEAISKALGADWDLIGGNTNIPIWFNKTKYRCVGARVQLMPLKPDLPLVAKPRDILAGTFMVRGRSGLPAFTVINCHFIAGGYNGPQEAKRKRQWDIEWQHLCELTMAYKRKGTTTFVIGDFNHPRPPKPVPNFMWLVGEHLDRIGVSRSFAMDVDEIDDGTVDLKSDHNGQWTRVILNRPLDLRT